MTDKATRERLKEQAKQAKFAKQQMAKPSEELSKALGILLGDGAVPSGTDKVPSPQIVLPPVVAPLIEMGSVGETVRQLQQPKTPQQRAKVNRETNNRRIARMDKGRLPDGSEFRVKYDVSKQMWSGTLYLADDRFFTGTASGVFRLLQNLDRMYRESLTKTEEKP